jgi:hypothetical protein
VRCPCSRCRNSKCLKDKRTIVIYLCKNDFVPGYEVWTFHDELGTRFIAKDEHDCDVGDVDRMDENKFIAFLTFSDIYVCFTIFTL